MCAPVLKRSPLRDGPLESDGGDGTFLSCLNFFLVFVVYQPFFLCCKKLLDFFSLDFGLPEFFFFLLWAHPPHHFSNGPPLKISQY